MSRFMLALLGDGSLDGVRVLSPSSRAALLQPQFRDHPRLPGVTYGFHQWATHGRMLLHHDGTLGDQVAVMLLDPANASACSWPRTPIPGIGNHLLEPVLTHLYGPAPAPAPPSPMPGAADAGGVAGVYLDTYRTRHDLSRVRALMPMLQSRVTADGPGDDRRGAAAAGSRWRRSCFRRPNGDPLVFRHVDGRADWRDADRGTRTYERIGWTRADRGATGLVVACLLVFAVVRRAPRCGRGGAGARGARRARARCRSRSRYVVFTVWLVASLRTLGDTTPLPLATVALLALGVAAAAGVGAAAGLRHRRRGANAGGRRGGRVTYTAARRVRRRVRAPGSTTGSCSASSIEPHASSSPAATEPAHDGPGAAGSPGRIADAERRRVAVRRSRPPAASASCHPRGRSCRAS